MLPMVRYTGYADLLRKRVISVLSVEIMIGMIVAPGSFASRILCRKGDKNDAFGDVESVDLSAPPPVTSVHPMIDTLCLVLVEVVALGGKDECLCKFWISEDGADACYNIAEINVESLATNYDLLSDEWQASWQMVVDDFVEFCRSLV